MSSEIKVDTISENTSANGVSIDGVKLKDNVVTVQGTSTTGGTIEIENTDTSGANGDFIGKINFKGNDSSSGASGTRAAIEAKVVSNFGSTELHFKTAGSGASATDAMVIDMNSKGMDMDTMIQISGQDAETITTIINSMTKQADGGLTSVPGYTTPAGYNKFDYTSGGVRVGKAEGGIMATDEASEMIDMGGMEKDYREEGGFVAMGGEERADDVPARLSRNEFVFTADAVRNAGGGDIDRGSEVMQNLMDNLEQGGQVSEDSQGLGGGEEMMSEEIIEEPDGAQAMYEQQQALQSRMI